MKDKEKIREDVSKLIIPESECNGMSLMEKGRQYAYREVLGIIDSTSEEPVSEECIYNRTLEERQRSCKFCSAACQVRIKEPISEDLEEEIGRYFKENGNKWAYIDVARHFANWQKQQDQETIELAEDHAYFAGRTKTIDEIKEALLSEVLPCFMHGGEADEVVAKLDEVLSQKK